jgi:hypothetical protein
MNRLEAALLSPAIAGELKTWLASVEEAAATFAVDWTRHLHTVVHVQYQEIAKSDPELSHCVEKMIATEEQLLQDLAHFHEELHALREQAEKVGWHENKLAGRRQHLEEKGTQLILQVKKQQLAAATWLTEAVFRDRGTKD